MRPHDWAFFVAIAAAVLAISSILRADPSWAVAWIVLAAVAGGAARIWSRKYPGPMPHVRWVLFMPRGPHSPERLKRVLEPRSGERILEIGPGVGIHALPVARSLVPTGVLEVLDVQQGILDHLMRRATAARIANIVPKKGEAQKLPYGDGTFDAAYLITVLGEVPDEALALRELRRVLRPDGRLIIGEILIDPDFISLRGLMEKASACGFTFERSVGFGVAYFARFRPTAVAT